MSITDLDPEEAGTTVIGYPSDIEEECEEIYQRMYDEQMTIEDVILMLERYKSSSNTREVEVYSCMVHFLFDEFRFFSSYPPRQLTMTGYFFGSLIQHSLIDMIPLGIALRYVLDGLVMSPDSNLFKFGITALSRFESRIADWPPMVDQLLKIPTLADHRPDLVSTLQRLRATESNGDTPASPVVSVIQGIETLPSFTALKPDTIDSEIQVPVEELSDRILFIVNNLAPNNFEAKLKEMKDLYEDEFSHWFANYLVDQRISTEPNNHTLYLRFLDSLERAELFRFILHETLVKALALLNSEGTMLAGPERLLLKNVGSWLGAITLARDRPIRHKNFAFKELLLEGFDSGKLAVAIPFVCKVLEGCTKSKVFKPPNPWLMGVMSLLAELYHFGDLKLNFKFEIEVLCKALDINLEDLEPSTSMRNRPMHDQMAGPPLPEYANDIEAIPMLEYSTASNMASNGSNDQVISLGPSSPSDAQRNLGPHLENILVALSQLVIINAQFVAHGLGNAVFKRAVQLAIDRAVREVFVLSL
jgi:CCR4-NOT transcription complex subunit 1